MPRDECSILASEGDVCASWHKARQSTKNAPNFGLSEFSEVRQEKDQISLVWGIPGSSLLATLGAAAPVGSGSEGIRMEDVKQLTPEQIMNLGMAFSGSKTLLSAVEIGLFTELAKEPLDLETLSERLMLHPRSARDFLDALVALGMLERNGDQYE